MRHWTGRLLDRLLPQHCVLCGMAAGTRLCRFCEESLQRPGAVCPLCALPLRAGPDAVCGACMLNPPPWDDCIAALAYRYPAKHLVRRFKFGRDLAAGSILAQELLRAVRARGGDLPELLVPVPLHGSRGFVRSFNQAELLAGELSAALGIPLETGLLRRIRRTAAQSGLDAEARRKNIRGAFFCELRATLPPEGVHLAVVDDVMTTGATLRECALVLRRAGVARLSVWTAARAVVPRH